MATPPDFSVGQVLTAAQMNAVGLWLVKTVTIGTSVSSVTVTNCFTSDYDNYRVVISIDRSSANLAAGIYFTASATGYYGSLYYDSSTGTVGQARKNNSDFIYVALTTSGGRSATSFDVFQPNKAEFTMVAGNYYGRGFSGWFAGSHDSATAQTGITLMGESGSTFTGGTIRVYGYRN